jgi:hypothetical protein
LNPHLNLFLIRRSFLIKTWKPFYYQQVRYDLSHLNEFECTFVQDAKNGKPEITYFFIIEFGLHCFTRSLNSHKNEQWDSIKSDLLYSDSREKRIFDFNRYELSKKLPAITSDISKNTCFHTGKENFFIIELLNEQGVQQEYEVYFQVSKSKDKLKLFVQSAYIRDSTHRTSQPKKHKISFFIIAYNVKSNKKIKPPPK